MDHDNFISLLNSRKGASQITFTAITEPNWISVDAKKNPFVGNVWKRCRINGMINWQYERSVNLQRMREGKPPIFIAQKRKWGVHVLGDPILDKNGNVQLDDNGNIIRYHTPWIVHTMTDEKTKVTTTKTYLQLKCQNVYDVEYVDADHNPVPFDVTPYVRKRTNNPRQELDNEIIVSDYNVAHIIAFSWNGITDTLEHKQIAA